MAAISHHHLNKVANQRMAKRKENRGEMKKAASKRIRRNNLKWRHPLA